MQVTSDTLSPETKQTVLALLRSALWGQKRFPFLPEPGTDWAAVYTELKHQTVQHLPVDLLVSADPGNAMLYIQNAARNIQKWHYLMQHQQAICHDLAQLGIPCAILKGAAAACYYPKPEHRCMGDIDLIVRPADFDRALAYFRDPWEILHQDPRHTEIKGNKLLLELHRRFSAFRSPQLRDLLDGQIYADTAKPEICTLNGFTFPRLSRTVNGLVLLTHINSHMERGLGLRQMIDWMMYVDRELDDALWQGEFARQAQALGLEKLAITVTRMCQLYLGLREDITWCAGADPELCRELLEHTFRQGNFGRKLPQHINIAVGFFSTARNIPGFFREMQRRGMITWPAAQKYRILRPLAWLHQLFRYLRLGLQMEHPLRYLHQAFTSEKTQGSLLDRLEVSRMNNDH